VRYAIWSTSVAVWLALSGVAYADGPQTPADGFYIRDYQQITQSAPAQPWWSMTFDLVVKLGLVIGLIYLTMWALRTYVLGPQAKAKLAKNMPGRLEVLDSTTLGPNRTVYLVEVADRVLVLGATQSSLSTLAEIKEPAAIDLLKTPQAEGAAPASFADQLKSLTGTLPVATAAPSFLHDKIGELRALAGQFRRPVEEANN
jgi:flagellar protein FliO/FliZ